MNINSIFQLLIPKSNKFFVLFEKTTENLLEGSKVLDILLNTEDAAQRTQLISKLGIIENRGDEFTHEIIRTLNQSFITPFDREDIYSLATSLDDILDFIYASARSVEIYKVPVITPEIKKLGALILKASAELNKAVPKLASTRNVGLVRESTIAINSIENEADIVFEYAVAELFSTEKDAVQVIKMKEVLSLLEMATDKAEDAAYTLESILLKAS